MDTLRRHMFMIVSAVAGLGGIALAVTGLSAMPKVVEELEKGKKLFQDLGSLQQSPVNQESIQIEEHRIKASELDRDAVFAKAKELYAVFEDGKKISDYEPMVLEVFPNGNDNALRRFRKQYAQAMNKLLEPLIAGQPATKLDIDAMQDKIVDEQYRAGEKGLDAGAKSRITVETGPARTRAGVLTKTGARNDATARAHIAAARKIYCYVTDHRGDTASKNVPSLDFHPAMVDTATADAPFAEDAWAAQVGYWIQRDVIQAIAAVNNEAAEGAKTRGDERWVGMMPVKDIISIRLSGNYVVPDEDAFTGAPASDFSAALPPGTANTVYTGHVSDETYEVMQFSLKLVMDQRDIPRLVEELTTDSFHTLLRIAYSSLPPNRDMQGKIYGSEPVVIVVMDFETVMLGDMFRPLMPELVCESLQDADYGMSCPEPAEEEDEEG